MAPDRESLSPAERRARRARIRRRAAQREQHQAGGRVYRLRRHGRSYRLWAWEGKIAKCMRAGKPYEAPLLEYIYQQRFTGTAIDGGANLGNHTLWFAVMCGLKVAAFEPLWHQELQRNVELNGLQDRVSVYPFALGTDAGSAKHLGKGRLQVTAPDVEPIPVQRLDDRLSELRDVSVMKLDIEGMEPAALAGAEATIKLHRPVIFAEEWGEPEHDAIAAVLEPWGYRMTEEFRSKGVATAIGRWDG